MKHMIGERERERKLEENKEIKIFKKKIETPVGTSIIIDDGKQQCSKESSLQLSTLAFSLI